MDIGKRIQQLREERGVSRDALARTSGMAATSIYRIETGRRPTPSSDTLEKLARGLGVSVGDFFEDRAPVGKAEAPESGRPQPEVTRDAYRLGGLTDPKDAAEAIQEIRESAICRRKQWGRIATLSEEHDLNLPCLLDDLGGSVIVTWEQFWNALDVLKRHMRELGFNPNPVAWDPVSKREILQTGVAIQLLSEFYTQLRRFSSSPNADGENLRALRGEFDSSYGVPEDWTSDPAWSEAKEEVRRLAGVGG